MKFNSAFSNDATKSIGFLFIKAYNIWHTSIGQSLKRFDLTHSQFVVITSLGYLSKTNEAITQTELARYINMDTMTLSKLLKKLIKMECVSKTSHDTDTRAKVIHLTNKGEAIMNETLKEVEQIDEKFFGKITLDERIKLSEMLSQLGADDE